MNENAELKKEKNEFYNKSPELISKGKRVDIKYVSFSNEKVNECILEFYFKTKKFKPIKEIHLEILDKSDNAKQKFVEKKFEPFKLVGVTKTIFNKYPRAIYLSLDMIFQDLFNTTDIENNVCYEDKYDYSKLYLQLVYYDNEVEKINLQSNSETMFSLNVLTLRDSPTKIASLTTRSNINEFDSLMGNTQNYYLYKRDLWEIEVTKLIQIIKKSNNYDDIVKSNEFKEEIIFFPFVNNKCLSESEMKTAYSLLKELYYGKGSDISKGARDTLILVLENINNKLNLYDKKEFNSFKNDDKNNIDKLFEKDL